MGPCACCDQVYAMDSASTFSGLISSVRLYSPPALRFVLRVAADVVVAITNWAPNLSIVAMQVGIVCNNTGR